MYVRVCFWNAIASCPLFVLGERSCILRHHCGVKFCQHLGGHLNSLGPRTVGCLSCSQAVHLYRRHMLSFFSLNSNETQILYFTHRFIRWGQADWSECGHYSAGLRPWLQQDCWFLVFKLWLLIILSWLQMQLFLCIVHFDTVITRYSL